MLGWLHGVTLSGLTHARVSADYQCWTNTKTGVGAGCRRGTGGYWDFNVGPPTLLSWASECCDSKPNSPL